MIHILPVVGIYIYYVYIYIILLVYIYTIYTMSVTDNRVERESFSFLV